MARNYEKNFGRLNRLWLEKGEVHKEKRPKLFSLKTADDISKWLPSIKEELDFFLKQTEVPCYTENKIKECRKHIMYLEAEYKAFVRKLHQLDSKRKTTPWTARPYEKKEKGDQHHLQLHPIGVGGAGMQLTHLSPLHTPVLMNDFLYQDDCDGEIGSTSLFGAQHDVHINLNDAPLFESKIPRADTLLNKTVEDHLASRTGGVSRTVSDHECGETTRVPNANSNVLGIDYSSSSDDEM